MYKTAMQQIFLAYTKYLCGQHGLSNIIYDLSLNMTKLLVSNLNSFMFEFLAAVRVSCS